MDYWRCEALRWLDDALEDLSVAKELLESRHYSASCFHSQQAAEKAVKGALYKNRIEARGHSILALIENLERTANLKLLDLYDHARLLDKHYAPTRYPNLHPSVSIPTHELYSKEDAKRCIDSAEKIVNSMKKLLES